MCGFVGYINKEKDKEANIKSIQKSRELFCYYEDFVVTLPKIQKLCVK